MIQKDDQNLMYTKSWKMNYCLNYKHLSNKGIKYKKSYDQNSASYQCQGI